MDQNITTPSETPAAPSPLPTPAPRPRWNLTLAICVLLLFVLAAFVGSFRASNSDIWMTLASGRLLASGEYQFGVDPFSWASDGAYWANPTWLGSWFMFAMYQTLGASSLVVMKAIVMVIVAGFLFSSRSKDSPLLPTIEVIALTIIAVSSRLLLQTAIFSYLGTAILGWLLIRSGVFGGLAKDEAKAFGLRWQVPLLFLIWSNCDGLYVLGLGVLALAFIGLGLTRNGRDLAKEVAIALGLSLVASVLNPHFLANLTMPIDIAAVLSPGWTAAGITAAELSVGDANLMPVMSPFSSQAFTGYYSNIAGIATYLFFAVAIGSFVAAVFVPDNPRFFARALVGVGFLILACVQIRLVPIFAILVGPLVVLNITDYARWTKLPERASRGGVIFATGATALTLLVAVALAWPGWLHLSLSQFQGDALFNSPRRVDWTFAPDPSLKSAVEAFEKKSEVGEVRVFHSVFDVAHYASFFAPRVRSGIDLRLALFAKKAAEYAEVRNTLWLEGEPPGPKQALSVDLKAIKQMHKRLDDWGVNGIVVTLLPRTFEAKNLSVTSRNNRDLSVALIRRPETWTPLTAEGGALSFIRRPAAAPAVSLLDQWRHDAFGVTPPSTWRSPEAASLPPREMAWETLYANGLGNRPSEIDTSALRLAIFREQAGAWIVPFFCAQQTTQFVAPCSVGGGGAGLALALQMAQKKFMFDIQFDMNSNRGAAFRADSIAEPAVPLLMYRDLRAAVQKNPLLAESYNHLADAIQLNLDQENYWVRPRVASTRIQLRQMEIAAARRAAVTLNPQSIDARLRYLQYLGANHYLDVAFAEHGEMLAVLETLPVQDEFAKQVAQERKRLQENYEDMKKEMKKRREDFELRASGQSDWRRFQIAVTDAWTYIGPDNKTSTDPAGRGLVLEGLKALEQMKPANDEEKAKRAYWLILMYSQLGMVNEAFETLVAAEKEIQFSDPECNIWIGVTTGYFDMIDKAFASLEKRASDDVQRRLIPAVTLGLTPLATLPTGRRIGQGFFTDQFAVHARMELEKAVVAQAECRFLRGLFTLERGDAATAGKLFDAALESGYYFPDRLIAERYQMLIRQQAK